MERSRLIVVAAVLAGLALLVVAGVYFASTAASLPSFFPGHQAGSTHHHTKHGVAALVVALGCFALAWFQTGPRNRPAA
ncbi:MAG TPA: hypothetical protein VGN69_03495 [Solirubrobacteraceae bacterium]|nr:hypothetical protein [Solirubrobacteraceae bacterium]